MQLFILLPLVLSLLLAPGGPTGSTMDANQRAQELAAKFNKSKHKEKNKRGIHIDIKIDITSVPAVKPAGEYAGFYEADDSLTLKLEVSPAGIVSANGTEPGPDSVRAFSLRDGQLDGALLTGTKVFSDGSTEKFEAVFIERTLRSNHTDGPETIFGLGVVYETPKRWGDHGLDLGKLFYARK